MAGRHPLPDGLRRPRQRRHLPGAPARRAAARIRAWLAARRRACAQEVCVWPTKQGRLHRAGQRQRGAQRHRREHRGGVAPLVAGNFVIARSSAGASSPRRSCWLRSEAGRLLDTVGLFFEALGTADGLVWSGMYSSPSAHSMMPSASDLKPFKPVISTRSLPHDLCRRSLPGAGHLPWLGRPHVRDRNRRADLSRARSAHLGCAAAHRIPCGSLGANADDASSATITKERPARHGGRSCSESVLLADVLVQAVHQQRLGLEADDAVTGSPFLKEQQMSECSLTPKGHGGCSGCGRRRACWMVSLTIHLAGDLFQHRAQSSCTGHHFRPEVDQNQRAAGERLVHRKSCQ